MNRTRFCLITTVYPPYHPGGCGLHVYHLANLLAEDGHYVEVVYSADAYKYKLRRKRAGAYPHHPNVVLRGIKSGVGKLSPLFTYLSGYPLGAYRQIKKILEKEFDVIHYHNISLFGGLPILGLGKGVKLFTLHTYWLFCPAHYLWKMGREGCQEKECLSCLLYYRRPPQFWRYTSLRERMLDKIDALIIPCRFMIERHLQEGFKKRMECIPYFVHTAGGGDTELLDKEFSHLRPFFLFVARLEAYKGPQVAVSAFRKKKGDSNLLMVGTGTMGNYLEDLAGDDRRIKFLSYVPPEKLSWFYQNAVALIAPSVWPEMGNQAVSQAQSCGTPTIAADSGFLREVVGETGSGIMYQNQEELIKAMDMMEDPRLREKYSSRARSAYQRFFTPEKFKEKYYPLLEGLINRK